MKTLKTIITLAVSALSVSMTATASAAEIPRATAPLNATEKQILIVENLIGDILDEVQNGLDVNTDIKEAHTKIYQTINPAFYKEVQFSIDTCYRDIPAVDMAVYNRARKLMYDAYAVFECLK